MRPFSETNIFVWSSGIPDHIKVLKWRASSPDHNPSCPILRNFYSSYGDMGPNKQMDRHTHTRLLDYTSGHHWYRTSGEYEPYQTTDYAVNAGLLSKTPAIKAALTVSYHVKLRSSKPVDHGCHWFQYAGRRQLWNMLPEVQSVWKHGIN